MLTGWQHVTAGTTWHPGAMVTGWQNIGISWYYFGDDGRMATDGHPSPDAGTFASGPGIRSDETWLGPGVSTPSSPASFISGGTRHGAKRPRLTCKMSARKGKMDGDTEHRSIPGDGTARKSSLAGLKVLTASGGQGSVDSLTTHSRSARSAGHATGDTTDEDLE